MKYIAVFLFVLAWSIQSVNGQKLEFKTYDLSEFSILKKNKGDDDPIRMYRVDDAEWAPIGPRASNLAPYLMSYTPSADAFSIYNKRAATAQTMSVVSAITWSITFIGYTLDDEDTLNGNGWDYAILSTLGTALTTGIWSYYARKSARKKLRQSIDLYNGQF